MKNQLSYHICFSKNNFIQRIFIATMLMLTHIFVYAQQYDILIKNGNLIDPKNHINAKKDVAVAKGKIALVADDIPASQSKRTIDATGLYVVPGLIDIHTHVFVGTKADQFADGFNSVSPDDFT